MNMNNKLENFEDLVNAVRKNQALIESHIGRRGNKNEVHGLATFEMDGFMSSDDKVSVDFKGKYATTVSMDPSQTQDVLTLGIGLYIGRYFTNLPSGVDDSLKLIRISGAGQGAYKVIELYWITANKKYTRMVYNTIDSGWYDGQWINLELKNGYTGYAMARRDRLGVHTLVELVFELEKSDGIEAVPFTTLGVGYSSTIGKHLDYIVVGTVTGQTVTNPLTLKIANNSDVILYRQTTDTTYDKASGHIMFLR